MPLLTLHLMHNSRVSSELQMTHADAFRLQQLQCVQRHQQHYHHHHHIMSSPSPVGQHYEELWRSCAGPLVTLPKLNQLVMYLPQGHIEQIIVSTNQGEVDSPAQKNCQLPKHDLQPHILCRVMDIQLSAEPETDEVKAQISLLPEPEGTESVNVSPQDQSAAEEFALSKPKVHVFCKTLTASDTSTHGGFSIPRKYASCLPPLDMTQFPPTQELIAKDLHGIKWMFRHIYRGQPKRHLLTTGWSTFVSQKKLVAGDVVIFLRGEDGELRVGIRRQSRLQNSCPSSVLPSQSMHMGVIATATHAILTRTLFSVYYKPRTSPADFIIPLERFNTAQGVKLHVGTRFKMKFEAEDALERTFVGTITGIEDLDPERWPKSKWRSLKVRWDEPSNIPRPGRVSPWDVEIMPSQSKSGNPVPGSQSKRFRPNMPSPSPVSAEISTISSGRSNAALEPMLSANFMTVLQGQEAWTIGPNEHVYHGSNHIDPTRKTMHDCVLNNPHQHPWIGNKLNSLEHFRGFTGLDTGGCYFNFPHMVTSQHQLASDMDIKFMPTLTALEESSQGSLCNTFQLHQLNVQSPLTDLAPTWLSNQMMESKTSSSASLDQRSTTTLQKESQFAVHVPIPSTVSHKEDPSSPVLMAAGPTKAVEAKSSCKLFGISLIDLPNKNVSQEVPSLRDNTLIDTDADNAEHIVITSSAKLPMVNEGLNTHTETDISSRDGPCRGRSCTKVVKKGSIIGRGVDLSKLEGYDELFEELEHMFQLEGQLRDKEKGWLVAYSDNEDDMLEVGDEPWMEFCNIVKKIYILSRDEVSQGSEQSVLSREPAFEEACHT